MHPAAHRLIVAFGDGLGRRRNHASGVPGNRSDLGPVFDDGMASHGIECSFRPRLVPLDAGVLMHLNEILRKLAMANSGAAMDPLWGVRKPVLRRRAREQIRNLAFLDRIGSFFLRKHIVQRRVRCQTPHVVVWAIHRVLLDGRPGKCSAVEAESNGGGAADGAAPVDAPFGHPAMPGNLGDFSGVKRVGLDRESRRIGEVIDCLNAPRPSRHGFDLRPSWGDKHRRRCDKKQCQCRDAMRSPSNVCSRVGGCGRHVEAATLVVEAI